MTPFSIKIQGLEHDDLTTIFTVGVFDMDENLLEVGSAGIKEIPVLSAPETSLQVTDAEILESSVQGDQGDLNLSFIAYETF